MNYNYCSKCGTANAGGINFCAGCGSPIQNINQTLNTNFQQPVMNNVANSVNQQISMNQNNTIISMNYFKYLINSFIKPYTEYKNNEKALENIKNSAVISVIVLIAMVIINLITTMISSVRVTTFWSDEVKWVWENLKEVEYFKVIGQSLLIYIGVLVAISGVYFLASLVIKKDVKFSKLLGIVSTAFLPIILLTSILSPILSLIYSPLGIGVSIIGIIYGIIILLELINDAIVILNKDTKIYFNLICLSILVIGLLLIIYNVFLGSLGSLSSILG